MAGDLNLSVAEARAAIAAALRPISETETVLLTHALGRVLAADLLSPIDVPAHDNSAMDGYAFDGALLRADAASLFTSMGTVYAGAPFDGAVPAGCCVRIMTGAVMPAGCDTVVPQELCSADGDRVRIEPDVIRRGENRRPRGEDLGAGRPALLAGRVLKPADLGLVASLGIGELKMMRRLRVALFSTGDELRGPGQALEPGCIYDSNRYSLLGALQRLGMEVIDLGLVRDDPAALQATLQVAVAQADGGRASWLFALPGNPVAALVTFYAFAREALLQLAGAAPAPLPVLQARSANAIRKRPGRTEFQRGFVSPAPGGGFQVAVNASQGAGILRSMVEANALVVLGHEQESVAVGDLVDVWLFDGLV